MSEKGSERTDRCVKDKTVIALVSHETRIKTATLWSSSHNGRRVSREWVFSGTPNTGASRVEEEEKRLGFKETNVKAKHRQEMRGV